LREDEERRKEKPPIREKVDHSVISAAKRSPGTVRSVKYFVTENFVIGHKVNIHSRKNKERKTIYL
jgi:5-methylcytosine-specific restriction endonuclease McrA